MSSELPTSQASENNKGPILHVLRKWLAHSHALLEVGSGTGQHAVYCAPELPHLTWQTSDLETAHGAIHAWLSRFPSSNIRAPRLLDVCNENWFECPALIGVDAIYSANTAHIMHWPAVCSMFAGAGQLLRREGLFLLYGPFSYAGAHSSDGNRVFDQSLRARDAQMGIRDLDALQALAADAGLELEHDHAMPANNRLLLWRRR
jgi:cyclopropane fatty-acyl-phospholipid synthase-like methyltransferase